MTANVCPVADLIKISPSLGSAVAVPTPSPGPGLSCLCCVFYFKHGNPEFCHGRHRTWWTANIRELYHNTDKEYSQVAAIIATRQLENEINVLKNPRQAEERFRVIASGAGLSGTLM